MMRVNKVNEQNKVINSLDWSDSTKVPFEVYTDESIYKLEQENIFRGL